LIILTIRTDKPEAELGLFEDNKPLAQVSWEAHYQLAETIHSKIEDMLKSRHKTWHDIEAIACYRGPGSFTGLRIGISVGNALAYSQNVPIVGTTGSNWQTNAIEALLNGTNEQTILPEYGAPAHITAAKK
jgi:tRNA threonylcarbamoyladenosine biosynthesis protein TsaB